MKINLELSEEEALALTNHLGEMVASETENGLILDRIFFRLAEELRIE